MPKNLAQFFTMMDERLWFRMIVCFLPALVTVKLGSSSEDGSAINKISTTFLLIGVGTYVFWPRLRGWTAPAEDEAALEDTQADNDAASVERPGSAISSQQQLQMLAELRELCQEQERESDRLIAMEVAVNPQATFAEATRSALARRKILRK